MVPTRLDLTMMGGSSQEFEFALLSNDGPLDVTSDTVDLFLAPGYGKGWKYRVTSAPGSHFNAANGLVRLTIQLPSTRSTQTWWYELWRREASKPHIVGELKLIGSVRI